MYIVINTETGKFLTAAPWLNFITKLPDDDTVYSADEITATGIIHNDAIYNIEGTQGVGSEITVTVLNKEPIDLAMENVEQEAKSAAYIDYLSAMTGIDLPDEEEEELEEE